MIKEDLLPLDKLTAAYVRIREKIAELQKAFDTEVEALKAQQSEIAGAMKDVMQQMNVRSVNTKGGTAILTEKTRYFTADWGEFKEWVKKRDAFDLLEKRVAQGNMAKYLEDNPEDYPPGIQSETELTVSVRKPNSK